MFKVKLHSNHYSAVESTDNTLKMIGAYIVRIGDDVVFNDDGSVCIESDNDEFVKYAIINQGYVKSIVGVKSPPRKPKKYLNITVPDDD